MKLPKNYFEGLSAAKYKEYLKLLPNMKKENNKAITMLIFTFLALSFLGLFAINPTLSTMAELQKQLEDSKFVYDKLMTKFDNLSSLQTQYNQLTTNLPFVFSAIPQTPTVPPLVGQIEAIAKKTGVTINSLRVNKVLLSKNPSVDESTAFTFSVEAEGSYDDLVTFSSSIAFFNRLVTLDSVSLVKDTRRSALLLTVKGREYFKP